jgi:hypothetical protein
MSDTAVADMALYYAQRAVTYAGVYAKPQTPAAARHLWPAVAQHPLLDHELPAQLS